MHRFAPLFVLTLAAVVGGCKPQNATVTDGAFVGFFPVSSSRTVLDENIKFEDADVSFDIDCRESDERTLDGRDICTGGEWPPEHEAWLDFDGYKVIGEKLDPWVGEAIMTSEGDFQVSFHHRLPGGEDFRFSFVIDPAFQPVKCVQNGSGGVELENVDGDWVGNWSSDLDESERYEPGTLYYLQSLAYQFNPSDTRETWTLPPDWRAGYARGRFGPEDLFRRTTRYGLPDAYAAYERDEPEPLPEDLFYIKLDAGEDPKTSTGYSALIGAAERVSTDTRDEFNYTVGAELDALGLTTPFAFEPLVHDNRWRTPDGLPAGLDGWVGLHYNWVRLNPGSTLEAGGDASGEFFLTFEAGESQTRVLVQGTFNAENIRKDRWVTDDVEAVKLEENGTVVCGQDPSGE